LRPARRRHILDADRHAANAGHFAVTEQSGEMDMAKKQDKKDKDKKHDKKHDKKKADSANENRNAPRPADAELGSSNPQDEMRRISREAAWARMFGKNSAKNPFTGQT
jgi:hypothetical protein